MNLWQIVSESPFLSLIALWFLLATVFRIWNRLMRMLNIRKHGWPPAHCDADGDFRTEVDVK